MNEYFITCNLSDLTSIANTKKNMVYLLVTNL